MKYDYERINELRYYFSDEPKWICESKAEVIDVYQDDVMIVMKCIVNHNADEVYLNAETTEISFLMAKGPKESVDDYEDRLDCVFDNRGEYQPSDLNNWECWITFYVKRDDRDDSFHYFLDWVIPIVPIEKT